MTLFKYCPMFAGIFKLLNIYYKLRLLANPLSQRFLIYSIHFLRHHHNKNMKNVDIFEEGLGIGGIPKNFWEL